MKRTKADITRGKTVDERLQKRAASREGSLFRRIAITRVVRTGISNRPLAERSLSPKAMISGS